MSMRQILLLLLVAVHIETFTTKTVPHPAAAPALAPLVGVEAPLAASSPPLPPALPKPSPSRPRHGNILKVLDEANEFTVLLRLLRNTHVGDQVNSQLDDTNDGITFFAPTDTAFSDLKAGVLNKLTDEKQVELMQFHVVPTYITTTQFQTVSNPLMTKAGDFNYGKYQLNVTASDDGTVSITTGIDDANVGKTLYTDKKLAVYEVDKVLLPMALFDSYPAAAKSSAMPNNQTADDAAAVASSASRITADFSKNNMVVNWIMIKFGILALCASLSL